jgi:hypothetical protein
MKATTRMLAGLAFAAGLLCALGLEEQDSEAPVMSVRPAQHEAADGPEGIGSGEMSEPMEVQSLRGASDVQGAVPPSPSPVGPADSAPQTASD